MKNIQEYNLALFDEKEIRKVWQNNKWYFSVIDVVEALTDSINPRRYWSDLKIKLAEEGLEIELYGKIVQLKMIAKDGKSRITDCSDTEGILRIIQSIPSPKAEPFKRWLARVGRERIDEINDPELAMNRMKQIYEAKGYSAAWIEQRERGIITRHNLTDEWKLRGVNNPKDYAILTNEIYKTGFGLTAKEYKNVKKIHDSQNLRDSMTNIELALTNLGEAAAVEMHQENNSNSMAKLKSDTKEAGEVLNVAKTKLEEKLNRPVVSNQNYIDLQGKRDLIE